MRLKKFLIICTATFIVTSCQSFFLSAEAIEFEENRILEAELIGAKKLASLVNVSNSTDKTVIAWLWEDSVKYTPKGKTSDMAPTELIIPADTQVSLEVIQEGRWLLSASEKALAEKQNTSTLFKHRKAWRSYYQGKEEEASVFYLDLLESPSSFWAALRLGDMSLEKDIKKANGYYQIAYKNPNNEIDEEFTLKVANVAYMAEEYQRAAELYSTLLKKKPSSGILYLYRGNSYFLLSQLDQAIFDYTKGIELDPNQVDFYINRARAYEESGKIELAISDYQTYLSKNPSDSEVWKEFIDFLIQNNRKEMVKKETAQWITDQPKESAAWNMRGVIYFNEKNYVAALEDFKKAANLNPKLASAWYNQALCYENIGVPKEWTLEKKWQRLNEIQRCYEKFLQYSSSNQSGRDRAQKRIQEIEKYSGQVLDI